MARKRISKKGVDEKVATILLVGFIIALLIMGFLWGRQLIKQRVSKELALSEKQSQCTDVLITAIEAIQTGDTILLTLENKKDIKIEKFTFRIMKDSTAETSDSFEMLNSLEIRRYEITTSSQAETVDIIPWIKVAKSNFVPCSQQHVLAKVSQAL